METVTNVISTVAATLYRSTTDQASPTLLNDTPMWTVSTLQYTEMTDTTTTISKTTFYRDSTTAVTTFPVPDISTYDPKVENILLTEMSNHMAMLFLPVIVFIGTLMIIGSFGNMLVIYIYCFRYKTRSTNYFIIAMAVFDCLASFVAIPIDIFDLVHHFTFYDAVGCKIFRFVGNITTFGSSIVLVEIAFDRYFKICRPLTLGSARKSKLLCWLAGIIAVILSVPACILFGTTRSKTDIAGLYGYDCSIADKYQKSSFRRIFYSLIALIFVVTFTLLVGLYIRIWVEIRRRRHSVIGDKLSSGSQGSESLPEGGKDIVKKRTILSSVSDDDSSVFIHKTSFHRSVSQTSRKSRLSSITEVISNVKCTRTTKIFIAVTVAFVLSYLPTVIVQILQTTNKRLDDSASPTETVLMKLFARSHYINNAINPVIYSFLNINFRTHCRKLFKECISCGFARIKHSPSRGSFRKVRASRSDSNKSDHTKEYEMEHVNRGQKQNTQNVEAFEVSNEQIT